MTLSTAFGILVLLPALAHQSERDEMLTRLERVHDVESLYEETAAEGDRALITMAIVPAVHLCSANIERFLVEHKNFALEFGDFAWHVYDLANMYLYKALIESELGPHALEQFAEYVRKFKKRLEGMRLRGLIAYDPEENSRYVKPGVDLSTEELRGVLRLRHNLSAEVPLDPVAGGELTVHVTLATRILGFLCFAPEGEFTPDTVEGFIRLLHYFGAIYRLSFRTSDRMRYEDSDRQLVLEYLDGTLRDFLQALEKGEWEPKHWPADAESLERIMHQEL